MAKNYTELTGAFVSWSTPTSRAALGIAHFSSIFGNFPRFDTKKALRDCDLMRDIIANNPADVEELVKSVRAALGEGEREHVWNFITASRPAFPPTINRPSRCRSAPCGSMSGGGAGRLHCK